MPLARLTAARSEHYDDRKQIESYQNQHEFCGRSLIYKVVIVLTSENPPSLAS